MLFGEGGRGDGVEGRLVVGARRRRRSTNQGFRRSSGGINLSRSRMWREIRSNKRAPAVRGPRGACVPVKRRNRPEKRAASPSKPSSSLLVRVASSLHGLDGGFAQRVGI